MRPFKTTILLASILLCCAACDPARSLCIDNKSNRTLLLSMSFDENCNHPFIDSLKQHFSPKANKAIAPHTKQYTLFGMGGWSMDEFNILMACTIQIKLMENGKTIRVIEGEALRKMLPEKRKGLFKSMMTIAIDTSL